MSQQNKIAVEIPAEVLTIIQDALTKLQTDLMPYLVSLTADQKQGMVKMGDGTIAFVNKVMSYSLTNPEFIPAFLNMEDMQVDVNAVMQLSPISKMASQLNDNIEDTLTLCGSEALIAALMYYNSVKQAAKNSIPNAKTIYDDLSQRYPGRPKAKMAPEVSAQ